jgi:hypothetical protein
MSPRMIGLALAALLLSGCAANQTSRPASSHPELEPKAVAPAPQRVSVEEYLQFLDSLSSAVEDDQPREFNPRERASVERIDRELRSRLDGVDNIEQLNPEQQIAVFNLHEELQAVVIGSPRYRVICRREQTVGTHFRRTTCMTVEEFQRYQDRGQEFLRNAWRYMQPLN